MNTLPHKHQGIFADLTLYLIPMCVLIATAGIFLVDRSSSDQWERFVRVVLGKRPVYRTCAHAFMSLRAIPIFGLLFFVFDLLPELIVSRVSRSRVSVSLHVLNAWVLGLLSSFAFWYMNWIRIRVEGRGPLTNEITRASIFATAYAVVALIAVVIHMGIWKKDTKPEVGPVSAEAAPSASPAEP
jgi:hypothetical protein